MSLAQIFSIAGSGMKAQSVRLNTVASNLSNADTVAGSPETAYRAREVEFAAIQSRLDSPFKKAMAGVRVQGVVESNDEIRSRYQPGHPLADDEGYVYLSNVDPIEAMTNMISASRSYQNNVEMLTTAKRLIERTLRLGE